MVNKGKKDEAPGENKEYTIYVNAAPEKWIGKTISFDQVTKLAFPKPPFPNTEYQVVYADAQGNKDGTLAEGQEVKIKEGTQFDVTATDKS